MGQTSINPETPNGEKHVLYKTQGTCSQYIEVAVKDGLVTKCNFIGGCMGNTRGICQLVTGMKIEDVQARLRGIQCGSKGTSCPDQLCHALDELK